MMRKDNQAGFTLVEIVIAVAISLITLGAVFAFFVAQDKIARGQRELGAAQANARITADLLARDIRSTGFNVNPGFGIKVEQACGPNPYTPAGTGDACPNNSDRLTVRFRETNTRLFGCAVGVCPANNSNQRMVVRQPNGICPGGTGNCGASTIAPFSCDTAYANLPVSICAAAGFPCKTFELTNVLCDRNCGGGLGNTCTHIEVDPGFAQMTPPFETGAPGVDAARVYQIMDLDGDGNTELVFSDSAVGAAAQGLTPAQTLATFAVVAPYVEDFQIAVNSNNGVDQPFWTAANAGGCPTEPCNVAGVWNNERTVVWSFEDPDGDGTAGVGGYNGFSTKAGYNPATAQQCEGISFPDAADLPAFAGAAQFHGCSNAVRAIRYTLVVRAPHLVEDSQGNTQYHSVPGVEDNAAFNYAAGYPRRILTNIVTLRNLEGF